MARPRLTVVAAMAVVILGASGCWVTTLREVPRLGPAMGWSDTLHNGTGVATELRVVVYNCDQLAGPVSFWVGYPTIGSSTTPWVMTSADVCGSHGSADTVAVKTWAVGDSPYTADPASVAPFTLAAGADLSLMLAGWQADSGKAIVYDVFATTCPGGPCPGEGIQLT